MSVNAVKERFSVKRMDQILPSKGRLIAIDLVAEIDKRIDKYTTKTDSCWLWTGSTNAKGYPNLNTSKYGMVYVTRYIWQRAHGPIPNGLLVLHKCDTPWCVKLEHLFLGTHQDNMNDMNHKGRHSSSLGELNNASKLNKFYVILIRYLHSLKVMGTDLARAFDISPSEVSLIIRGRHWGHVNYWPEEKHKYFGYRPRGYYRYCYQD